LQKESTEYMTTTNKITNAIGTRVSNREVNGTA